MESVMERRNLVAGLMVLAVSLFLLTGTAFARHAVRSKQSRPAVTKNTEGNAPGNECIVNAYPGSFMDQGEDVEWTDHASSVAVIFEVECNPEYAEDEVTINDQELYNRCDDELSWAEPPNEPSDWSGPETNATLDDNGNAKVVAFGGPSCAAGETIVLADLDAGNHSTAMTQFTVLPPKVTPEGISVFPSAEGEASEEGEGATMDNSLNSSTVAIIQVEFSPEFAEEYVNISDHQLYGKCHDELAWYGPDEEYLSDSSGVSDEEVRLDDDGNAFVVVIGGPSCQAGKTVVEASLEEAPYTTYTTNLTVLPPEVSWTAEAAG
jgi:hypothetical protein